MSDDFPAGQPAEGQEPNPAPDVRRWDGPTDDLRPVERPPTEPARTEPAETAAGQSNASDTPASDTPTNGTPTSNLETAVDELATIAGELAAVAHDLTEKPAGPVPLTSGYARIGHAAAATPPPPADSAWAVPRQRLPLVLAAAGAILVAGAIIGFTRLVAAADGPSDPATRAALPPVVPNSAASGHLTRSPGLSSPVLPSGRSATPSPRPEVGVPSAPPSATPDAPVTTPTSPAFLRAFYSTAGHTTPPGYIGQVTVTNTGGAAAVGWRITISVGSHGRVSESTGADFQQNGSLVTFTPRGETLRVPPGGSVRFTFQVRGPKAEEPTGCAINNRPCG